MLTTLCVTNDPTFTESIQAKVAKVGVKLIATVSPDSTRPFGEKIQGKLFCLAYLNFLISWK